MKVVGLIRNEATTFIQQAIEDGEIVTNGYAHAEPLDELMQKADVYTYNMTPYFEELKYTPSLNISKHRNRKNHNQQSKRKAAKAARKQNRKNR
jgi:hypothetical protein